MALLTLLIILPLPTTAIHFDEFFCGDGLDYTPNPTAAHCRHIASRLPTNQTSHTHLPSHYLTTPSPFHPGGYFRYQSCLIVIDLSQDHLISSFGERHLSPSPALREEDVFTIWEAIRIVIEELVHECIDVEHAGGAEVTLDAWQEFDGQIHLKIYGDEGGLGDDAPNLFVEVYKDASMLNLHELDDVSHTASVPRWYEWDA